jgi:hypothetical protein
LETEHTFLLAKPVAEDNFSRIYLATNNKEDAAAVLRSLEGISVLNFPTKREVGIWEQLMAESRYKLIGVFERHYYPISEITRGLDTDFSKIIYANESQEEEIYKLYRRWKDFTPYIDILIILQPTRS